LSRNPKAPYPKASSNFADKVALRVRALGLIDTPTPKVLDCYAGAGKIWAAVAEEHACDVDQVERDPRVAQPDAALADNNAVLTRRELDGYDLIDLDAYGWPDEQLEVVAVRRRGALPVVTITCAGTPIGRVPNRVLDAADIPRTVRPGVPSTEPSYWWTRYTTSLGWRTEERWTGKRVGGAWILYETLIPA